VGFRAYLRLLAALAKCHDVLRYGLGGASAVCAVDQSAEVVILSVLMPIHKVVSIDGIAVENAATMGKDLPPH
jgi:hypothetical protein